MPVFYLLIRNWTESLPYSKIPPRVCERSFFGGNKLANIKSQIKRNRQNDKRRLTNRVYRGEARLAVKTARTAFEDGAPTSREELLKAISALDKAVEKGVLHKNNAARRKSRLMKAFAGVKIVEVKAEAVAPAVETAPIVEEKPRRSTRLKAGKAEKAPVEEKPKKAAPAAKAAAGKTSAKKPAKREAKEPVKKAPATRKKTPAKK